MAPDIVPDVRREAWMNSAFEMVFVARALAEAAVCLRSVAAVKLEVITSA